MSFTQILLIVVVPLALGILGNLLTSILKRFAAKISRTYRARRARMANARQELINALAARQELATQYLLVAFVTCMTFAVFTTITMTGAIVVREISQEENDATLVLVSISAMATFGFFGLMRNMTAVYLGYLEAIGAPSVVVRAIIGDRTRGLRGKLRRRKN